MTEDRVKQSGEGFEVQSPEVGLYVINFSQPFVTTPSVVATLNN
jgi:hypothetical protein